MKDKFSLKSIEKCETPYRYFKLKAIKKNQLGATAMLNAGRILQQ